MRKLFIQRTSAVIALAFCLSFAGTLSGCVNPAVDDQSQQQEEGSSDIAEIGSPSDTVRILMEGIQTLDTEKIKSVVTKSGDNAFIGPEGTVNFKMGDQDQNDSMDIDIDLNDSSIPNVARNYAGAISYGITSEEIVEDYAYVEVLVKTPNLSDIIVKLVGEIVKQAAAQALKGGTVDYEAYVMDYLNNDVDFAKLPKTELTAKVKLVLENGEWLVVNNSYENKELVAGLSGGMANFVNDLLSYANM